MTGTDHSHHRHHGKVARGRLIVVIGCLVIVGFNLLIIKEASTPRFPMPAYLKARMAVDLLWLFTGAYAMCAKLTWGRYMALFFIYLETFGFFITAVIALNYPESIPPSLVVSYYAAAAGYLIVGLVLTHSRDVRRLTSRSWD